MTSLRSSSALLALALLGCGGGQSQPHLNLQGTWHFQTTEDRATLVGKHIITQQGQDILITYCNRLTYALKLQDGVLLDPRGLPYYLQPSDSDHLVGTGDSGARSQVLKTSNRVIFDSGSLSLRASGMDDLAASDNVCADNRAGRFGASDGTEIPARVVTLTAPYRGTFVRVQAAFKSLQPGAYSVQSVDPFVHAADGVTNLVIESPAFGDALGGDAFAMIASGTVQVLASDSGNLRIHGSVTTVNAMSISFSATVALSQ
jgi:hypothetical protein